MKAIQLTTLTALATTTLMTSGCATASMSATRSVQSSGAIYAFESDGNGFNTRSFFYDNGEEVVAFDTQFTPELARKSIEFLRSKTQSPITYVVITHPNPDKFNGMSEYQKLGAKVIASSRTTATMPGVHEYKKYFFVNLAKMFTEENYPRLAQADLIFEESYDLRLRNGETITLRELAHPGVSSNQTVAYVPGAHALVVGDLVHHQVHAWLEGGITGGKPTPTIAGWIRDLQDLKATYSSAKDLIVYGGRGEAAPLALAVEEQVRYLREADSIVTRYVASLGSRKSELLSDRASQHHQAIQALFEKAFPSYGLGYMIRYGVYGLANSKL